SLIIVHLNLRVVLGSNSRSGSVLLLGFGAASTMTSELGFLAAAAGYQGARQVGVAAASLAIVGLAAAIRHPSAAEIEDPVAGQQEPLTLARSWWLVLSFVAVAGSLLWFPRPDVPLAGLLVAVGALTTYNLFATIQERERLILIERTLRLSLAEVIQATTPPTILELSGQSADRLLADKSHVEVELLRRDGSDWVSCPEGATTKLGSDVEPLVDEAVLSGHHVRRELRSDLPGVGYVTRLAIPLADGGDHAEVLLTEVSPVLTTVEIEQLFQLAGATSRALVAYELTEATHQRRADRRFRALVQDSNDVVAIVDPESKDVTMISPSLERILGHRNDVFIGGPMGPHLHPEDADQVDELLRTAVTRPQTGAVDVRLRHDGGHYHWFSALVRDHTDDDDVGGLVLNLTDIHRRKLAELSLGFSEQRYRALVLNSRDVFAILEHDLTVNYISPNVETVLGYPAADLMATDMATLLPDSSSARLRELIEAA
ncbi:MAG: PAS domain S-box protein, partial [Actinomycetota bacterium]